MINITKEEGKLILDLLRQLSFKLGESVVAKKYEDLAAKIQTVDQEEGAKEDKKAESK